jgi:hypothetical protein
MVDNFELLKIRPMLLNCCSCPYCKFCYNYIASFVPVGPWSVLAVEVWTFVYSPSPTPCGGGLEYLHRSPCEPKRRRRGNTVSDETAKQGYWLFNDLTSECSHSKLQTRPLVREGALQEKQNKCH